jgi:large subunit ribosomal protein L17
MRHRVHGSKLGRTTAHRKAMVRNQLTALFTHERITTTLAKAKNLRPVAERMVTLARTGTLPARRKVLTMVSDKEIVRRLFDEIAPRFMDRPGGYTRVLKLGRRHGDNAPMAIIELVDYELKEGEGPTGKEKKESLMDKAKGMFGGGAKEEAETKEVEAAEAEVEAEAEAEAEEVEAAAAGEPDVEVEPADDAEAAEATAEAEPAEEKKESE